MKPTGTATAIMMMAVVESPLLEVAAAASPVDEEVAPEDEDPEVCDWNWDVVEKTTGTLAVTV